MVMFVMNCPPNTMTGGNRMNAAELLVAMTASQ